MKNTHKRLICIVGATASGKTGLGVELAKELNGEIISADSRQVFRGLDIGTGKEGEADTNLKIKIQNLKLNMNSKFKIENFPSRRIDGVEQWLIDICEPEEAFTMFDWLELARMVLEEIWSRGKTPIVVGGTGLYVQALIEGFEVEKTKEQKDKKTEEQFTRKELETKSKEELAEILINLDEEAFLTIDLNNPYRMVRAIEKAQSGEKLTKNDPGFEYLLIGKELPREELYSKIDRRVDEWFEEGFYEEVESLLESGVSLEWLNKIGLEYRILAQYIVDQKSNIKRLSQADSKEQIENSFDDMRQAMKYAIHQYARRQLIWWRRFDAKWIKDKESALMLAKDFLDN